jgi:hypothetical protein
MSFSLFVVYSIVNFDFGLPGKMLLFSTAIVAPITLLTGIVLIYLGGWRKKNDKTRKEYLSLFALAVVFIFLAAALSAEQILSYHLPLNPIFALAACIVLAVEAIMVWRLSIRKGRKAIV